MQVYLRIFFKMLRIYNFINFMKIIEINPINMLLFFWTINETMLRNNKQIGVKMKEESSYDQIC